MKAHIMQQNEEKLAQLERIISYQFQDKELLKRSLRHRSIHADGEYKDQQHNETLEFLGDAVLSLVAAQSLFTSSKHASEGDLSRMRAEYVCKENLIAAAQKLNLAQYMQVAKSMRSSGLMGNSKMLSDVVEAIIGAVFIDGGLPAARKVVELMLGEVPQAVSPSEKDAKTALQEKIQHLNGHTPTYVVLSQEGPAHEPIFVAAVKVGEIFLAQANGKNKKEATLASAEEALLKIQGMSAADLKLLLNG